MKFEEEYADVLQNIEMGIILAYNDQPNISDHDVRRVLEAVVDAYRAENIGREPRAVALSDDEQMIMDSVRGMCEFRLGRESPIEFPSETGGEGPEPITIDELVQCLKRILKSLDRWNRSGGRQGYLNFISQFIG